MTSSLHKLQAVSIIEEAEELGQNFHQKFDDISNSIQHLLRRIAKLNSEALGNDYPSIDVHRQRHGRITKQRRHTLYTLFCIKHLTKELSDEFERIINVATKNHCPLS